MSKLNDYLLGFGTAFILLGWCFAASGALPLNYMASGVGCALWMWAGIRKKDMQVIVLDSIVTILSIIALMNYIYHGGAIWPY